jgi:hypothetical protein
MPSINEAFPSKYLKAADLKGRNVVVTIDRAEYEQIGDDRKLILYFEGKEKGVVLNKTNANNIAATHGDDTDDWKGQQVVLFEAMVDFQGKTVPAIRIRMPQAKDRPQQRQAARPSSAEIGRQQPQQSDPAMADDEIPF